MNHWSEHRHEIARRLAAPQRMLIACDFDGTLSPLVDDPSEATLIPGMHSVLLRLSTCPGVALALLSGRGLADLFERIPSGLLTVAAGSHGLELHGHGLDGLPADAAGLAGKLQPLVDELQRSLRFLSGITLEEKPRGLAVHSRMANPLEKAAAASAVTRLIGRDSPFRVQEGHDVIEIIPKLHWDKGTALRLMLDRLGIARSACLCVGDDLTDEAMFQALPNAITVKVGYCASAAKYHCHDPQDVLLLLQEAADVRMAISPIA